MGSTVQARAVTYLVNLEARDCPTCGTIYGIPDDFLARKRKSGGTWYCPNGHPISFIESEADKQRKWAEQLAKELATRDSQLNDVLGELSTAKKEIKRVRQRVDAGVCPDCHRHFTNLERHRKTKHTKGG